MSVSVEWANADKTLVLQKIDGQWSMMDFHEVVQKSARLLATVDHEVDIIIDLSTTNYVPQGIISGASRTESTVPPNQRLVVIVGAKMMHKLLLSLGKRLAPRAASNQHFVETVAQAHELIEHYRAKETS